MATVNGLVSHQVVERVDTIIGAPIADLAHGWHVTRVESQSERSFTGTAEIAFEGIVQHLAYARAAEQRRLEAVSAGPRRGMAVLIPIRKSAAWWALAADERAAHFRRSSNSPGHIGIGEPFARKVHRRLYHARYLPGSSWDFLTYFEFHTEDTDKFRELVHSLRDTKRNPEWSYVERETEIWLRPIQGIDANYRTANTVVTRNLSQSYSRQDE